MSRSPVSIAQAKQVAVKKLNRNLAAWATQRPVGPALSLPLHPPTDKMVRASQVSAEKWVETWRGINDVVWGMRSWASVGRQAVPLRLEITDPAELADFCGGKSRENWLKLSRQVKALYAQFGKTVELGQAIKSNAKALLSLSPRDFERLLSVVEWLTQNDVQGMRPRALPIRGVDSKWYGNHRGLVNSLVCAITERLDPGITLARKLVRVRVLDETLLPVPLLDFAAPKEELSRLPIKPKVVFIFENLETVLAMPSWPAAVAIHGSGYAVSVLAAFPWIADPDVRVFYWGDLDSDGFAVLHQLRTHLPGITSVLMDEDTLLAHHDMWVSDTGKNSGTFASLTDKEERALDAVRTKRVEGEAGVRLEQERIPWAYALEKLRAAATSGQDIV